MGSNRTLLAGLVLALTLPGAAQARMAQPPVRAADPVAINPLTIAFGSYGAGIDGESLARIDRFLSHDRRVLRVERSHWGREGEVSLAVWTRRPADAMPLLRALRRLVSVHPRGPVHAETAAGASWTLPVPY